MITLLLNIILHIKINPCKSIEIVRIYRKSILSIPELFKIIKFLLKIIKLTYLFFVKIIIYF